MTRLRIAWAALSLLTGMVATAALTEGGAGLSTVGSSTNAPTERGACAYYQDQLYLGSITGNVWVASRSQQPAATAVHCEAPGVDLWIHAHQQEDDRT
jgi:hypothetical protein